MDEQDRPITPEQAARVDRFLSRERPDELRGAVENLEIRMTLTPAEARELDKIARAHVPDEWDRQVKPDTPRDWPIWDKLRKALRSPGMDRTGNIGVALFDGDDEITDDLELAKLALADTTGTQVGELAIEGDGIGGWTVELPHVLYDQLRENRWLGIENPRFRLEAEWV